MNNQRINKNWYTNSIAIRGDQFLLEISKSRPVPQNVVRDVPFEVLDLGRTTFEERVKDNFLCKSVSRLIMGNLK
jgi:hypothetical protein